MKYLVPPIGDQRQSTDYSGLADDDLRQGEPNEESNSGSSEEDESQSLSGLAIAQAPETSAKPTKPSNRTKRLTINNDDPDNPLRQAYSLVDQSNPEDPIASFEGPYEFRKNVGIRPGDWLEGFTNFQTNIRHSYKKLLTQVDKANIRVQE